MVRIKEADAAKVEEIVSALEHAHVRMGEAARAAYDQYFHDSQYFNYIVDRLVQLQAREVVAEGLMQRWWRLYRYYVLLRQAAGKLVRGLHAGLAKASFFR